LESGPGNGAGLGSGKPASRLSVLLAVAITTAAVLNLYPLSSPAQAVAAAWRGQARHLL
jgi:hypothetical protein